MNKIEVVVFTNEKYFNILYVTLPKIVENLSKLNIPINVVTTKLPTNGFKDVNFIETNVEFSPQGTHFRNSMLISLSKIESEYILFFCDDYMMNSPVNVKNFNSIMKIMELHNGDFFSFSSLNYCDHIISKWNKIDTELSKFDFDGGILYEIPNNYRHLYSVQPCIWKRESLIELIEHNDVLSISLMDNTNIKNKKGQFRTLNYETNYYDETELTALDYGFKNLTINYPPLTYNIDDRQIGSNYLVFDYGEILRYGKVIGSDTNSKKILMNFLNENQSIKEKISSFL
jgi:hypothetical protein